MRGSFAALFGALAMILAGTALADGFEEKLEELQAQLGRELDAQVEAKMSKLVRDRLEALAQPPPQTHVATRMQCTDFSPGFSECTVVPRATSTSVARTSRPPNPR